MVSHMNKFAIIEDGQVVNAALSEAPLGDNWVVLPDGVGIGWRWADGVFEPPLPPSKAPEQLQAEIVAATQQRLDDFARTRNYDDILSLCTYATSAVPKFKAEGQCGVNARDATWATLYQVLADVQAGTRPTPAGYADIEPLLPALEWPL